MNDAVAIESFGLSRIAVFSIPSLLKTLRWWCVAVLLVVDHGGFPERGVAAAFCTSVSSKRLQSKSVLPLSAIADPSTPSWSELELSLSESLAKPLPVSIDSVLEAETPFSTDRPTLFRERHGWCPYSERVWLSLELSGISYDTVRIDNTGGPRPSYYSGQTPQIKWPETSRPQGESMDLVREVDSRYCDNTLQSNRDEVNKCIQQFSNIFPRARPSSRAAFLFQYNGEPLWRSTFESTLQGVDSLLSQQQSSNGGPFFCGNTITAADIAWAPFLERYRYQLPCLHQGLEPDDASTYPHLAAWYEAMDRVPAYACRVKGDASSWRKVLTMAGFGNAGVPPEIVVNMKDRAATEAEQADLTVDQEVWETYASTRQHVANSPREEAACIITRNRKAIFKDTLKRSTSPPWDSSPLPKTEVELDESLRCLVNALRKGDSKTVRESAKIDAVKSLAAFLDDRMCVPRDMGAMCAASVKMIARDM